MTNAERASDLPDQTIGTSITVNGESCVTEARTLGLLLGQLGYSGRKIATARNGDFVPESARSATILEPGDRIEIVAPRQGG